MDKGVRKLMTNSFTYESGLTCAIQVKDLNAAIAWYQDALGFKLLYKQDAMKWAELSTEIPSVTVGLSQVEHPVVQGGVTLTWGVKDIHEARQAIEAKGGKFEGSTIEHPGFVRLATFYDPDGNKMMLFQDLTKTKAA